MSEQKSIVDIQTPNTRKSIANELKQLGIEEGMAVIVHSSLSSLGWVCGGPVAVVQALMDTVGEEGTVVMPTQSAGNSDPAEWENPPVPKEWWAVIRDNMPAYQADITPTRGMGVIVETFRKFPNVTRSSHPALSFAAWGKYADFITANQSLNNALGETSPLQKLYDLDGYILLLGVDHDNNTSFHLAEHSIPNRKVIEKGAAVLENGRRVWKTYQEIKYDEIPFKQLGKEFEKQQMVHVGNVGKATCKFMSQRSAVNFARSWFTETLEHDACEN